ncbi:hypothetical protein [Rufibacter aurantiacus]|uniref:hypothetical protein n=1 Tax=Rufibacter aurantiacus TaxID=2817374 RepID=UPI001B308B1A|nr:hypothetical protein [Rufibacter aurantiacus]
MNNPIVPLNLHESGLIREILEQRMPELDTTINNRLSAPEEAKKALISKESIATYLNAQPDETGRVALPPVLFSALLYNIRMAICKRAAAMVSLLNDESLASELKIQLAQDSALLLGLIRTFQDPSLPRLNSLGTSGIDNK